MVAVETLKGKVLKCSINSSPALTENHDMATGIWTPGFYSLDLSWWSCRPVRLKLLYLQFSVLVNWLTYIYILYNLAMSSDRLNLRTNETKGLLIDNQRADNPSFITNNRTTMAAPPHES